MGSRLTIDDMLLELPTQWVNSSSRKLERGVSTSLHLVGFVFLCKLGELGDRRSSILPCIIPVVETS